MLRALLSAAEPPYRLAVTWRNRRFDRSHTSIHRADVPIISVGNITAGGTGKTPMVAWLAQWFQARGVRIVLISRGYGARAGEQNDEALELQQELPDVPHLQNADRVSAAHTAVEQLGAQLILLDDAFQHRRIHRDLDLVLVDALEPFGYQHLLPRGLLREPLAELSRAHVIAISRSDLVGASERATIERQLRQHAPQALVIQLAHRVGGLLAASGGRAELAQVADAPLVAFCGIGNPAAFLRTLESCGLRPMDFREFADHHAYSAGDLACLSQWATSRQAAAVLCTRKDLVKIGADQLQQIPLWAVEIGIQIISGRGDLEKRLQSILPIKDQSADGRRA